MVIKASIILKRNNYDMMPKCFIKRFAHYI